MESVAQVASVLNLRDRDDQLVFGRGYTSHGVEGNNLAVISIETGFFLLGYSGEKVALRLPALYQMVCHHYMHHIGSAALRHVAADTACDGRVIARTHQPFK